MKRIIRNTILIAAAIFSMTSCLVENDMAWPRELANILTFEVSGQASVSINNTNRTVNIVLAERADITHLEVLNFIIAPEASCGDVSIGTVLDLTQPKVITVSLGEKQHYEWTISASQTIERYVVCDGQIGQAEFMPDEKRVYVSIADRRDIMAIQINDMKLEAEGSVITGYEEIVNGESTGKIIPIESFPITMNCHKWRYFIVELDGVEYRWGLFVRMQEVSTSVTVTNPWARHLEVEGLYDGEHTPYFQYKLASAADWTDFREVSISGVNVSASIPGLEPVTDYQVRMVSGETTSSAVSFTTEAEGTLHNMTFDDWYQDGKVWMPNLSADYHVWDSANPGSAILGVSPTTPTDDVAVSGAGKMAAALQSSTALGLLAAGNIYTGNFVSIAGLGAELKWGIPFTARPTGLKGWFKYNPVAINKVDDGYEHLQGKQDTCQVQILLTDWDDQFTINTSAGVFVDVENDAAIIAHGKMEYSPESGSMSEYQQFEIKIDYRSRTRIPRYIVISACASKYGDYFTGGIGSLLLVDEFEFIYE